MSTHQVPSHYWAKFFDDFTRRHKDWLVTIELMQPDIGDQIQARDLPLEGITVEPNEVGEYHITIMAGSSPDARISHTINAPRRVWLKQSEQGVDEALEIEAFSGDVLVRFRSAVLSEMVDGIVADKARA